MTAESESPVPVHNYRDLMINVVVTDEQGRQFDNISSLHFIWKLSDDVLGTLESKKVKSKPRQHSDSSTSESAFVCELLLMCPVCYVYVVEIEIIVAVLS